MEQTLFILKPEALTGFNEHDIKREVRKHDFKIVAEKRVRATEEQLRQHYAHLVDKPFFPGLLAHMTSFDVVVGILEKENAIEAWRELIGTTNPEDAKPGTIRARFGYVKDGEIFNMVHGSDSKESFDRERSIWFD